MSLHTDGNAIAGLMEEIFGSDMTTTTRRCQSCRKQNPIGAHRHYSGAGHVLRCPSCGDLAASFVSLVDGYAVGLHGMWLVNRSA
jgi:Family of unknown function (DUF6510)